MKYCKHIRLGDVEEGYEYKTGECVKQRYKRVELEKCNDCKCFEPFNDSNSENDNVGAAQ